MRGKAQPTRVEEGCTVCDAMMYGSGATNSTQKKFLSWKLQCYRRNLTGPVPYPQRNSADVVRIWRVAAMRSFRWNKQDLYTECVRTYCVRRLLSKKTVSLSRFLLTEEEVQADGLCACLTVCRGLRVRLPSL